MLLLGVGLTLNLPPPTLGVVGLAGVGIRAGKDCPMVRRAHGVDRARGAQALAGASGLALEAGAAPLQAGSGALFWGATSADTGAIAPFWLGLNLIERPSSLLRPR